MKFAGLSALSVLPCCSLQNLMASRTSFHAQVQGAPAHRPAEVGPVAGDGVAPADDMQMVRVSNTGSGFGGSQWRRGCNDTVGKPIDE
jgi:hypothetical protein